MLSICVSLCIYIATQCTLYSYSFMLRHNGWWAYCVCWNNDVTTMTHKVCGHSLVCIVVTTWITMCSVLSSGSIHSCLKIRQLLCMYRSIGWKVYIGCHWILDNYFSTVCGNCLKMMPDVKIFTCYHCVSDILKFMPVLPYWHLYSENCGHTQNQIGSSLAEA